MALNGNISLDPSIDPSAMIQTCEKALLGSILADGEIAEELDPKSKLPRQRFLNLPEVVFSVPYYLLRTAYKSVLHWPEMSLLGLVGTDEADSVKNDKLWDRAYKSVRSRTKAGFWADANVNMLSVTEDPCQPEWLFDYPAFFTSDEPIEDPEKIHKKISDEVEVLNNLINAEHNFPYVVLKDSVRKYKAKKTTLEGPFSGTDEPWSAVVDVIRTGKRESEIEENICYPKELMEKLWDKRPRDRIKRRLIYVYNCGIEMALALYLGTHSAEQYSVAGFLARHQRRDVFFCEHTHKAINSWVTELHLGFYRIVRKSRSKADDSDTEEDEEEETIHARTSIFPEKPVPCPDDNTRIIEKGAVGFRFVGDLYDRFWTCHVALCMPSGDPGENSNRWFADIESFNLARPTGEGNKSTTHSQRKILEAQLFEKATKIIVGETRAILKNVSNVLGEDDNGFYSSNAYDSFRQNFEKNKATYIKYGELIKFLHHVLENLRDVINTAKEWDNRHYTREVPPRWTHDDEAAFAEEITIWTSRSKSNVKRISLLEQQLDAKIEHMKQLRAWLLDDLNLKEARVSNRSADDVRIFTYATVIFLPLSFSSSIFSMADAPSHSTTVNFIAAAVIALVATCLLVLNAGILLRTLSSWKRKVFDLPNEGFVMEHSDSQWVGVGKSFNNWLVESPSKRVLMAWEVLKKPDKKQKGSHKKEVENEENMKKEAKSEPEESHNWSIVLIGLLLLPLFLIVYLIRFVSGNLYDLGKLVLIVIPEYPTKRRQRKRTKPREMLRQTSVDKGGGRRGYDGEGTKKKEGEKKATLDEEKEKLEADALAKKVKWEGYNLKHFMRQPRLDGITRHLAEGKTWEETIHSRKERKNEIERELRRKRRKYVKSRRRAEKRLGSGTMSPGGSSEDEDELSSSSSGSSNRRKRGKKSTDTMRVGFWANALRGAFPKRWRRMGNKGGNGGTDKETDHDPEATIAAKV